MAAWRAAGGKGEAPPQQSATKPTSVMGGATTKELMAAWEAAKLATKRTQEAPARKALRQKIEKVREFDPEAAEQAERALDTNDRGQQE